MLVFVNGEVAGFDLLLKKQAYAQLHPKLLKSYAMEALLTPAGKKRPTLAKAKAFLAAVSSCDEKRYRSVGLGWDCRFEGKGHVGSALLYHDRVIHAAFFATDESEAVGPMSDYRTRRGNRLRIIEERSQESPPPINLDADAYNADWIQIGHWSKVVEAAGNPEALDQALAEECISIETFKTFHYFGLLTEHHPWLKEL